MTTWVHKHPKARKTHRCTLCSRTIDPGEVYMLGVGLDDGTVWNWRECKHCETLWEFLRSVWGEEEYGPDDATEWYPETLHALRVKAQWRLKWRRRDGSLHPLPVLVTEQVRYRNSDASYTRILDVVPGVVA